MQTKPKTIKKCLKCGKEFQTYPYLLKKGFGVHCSRKCSVFNNGGLIKKGQRLSLKTEFKKGSKPWNYKKSGYSTSLRGKSRPEVSGDKNRQWKGDKVGYSGLHYWVYKILGKPTICKICDSTKNIQWANKSHLYKREKSDWIMLCSSCHAKYDETCKNRVRDSNGRFI